MLRILALSALIFGFSVHAEVITNGHLTVTVRNDNGAIESYIMDGVNYFGQGTYISDWGIQIGNDTSTFRINTTYGNSGIPVTVTRVSANQVDVSGIITLAGKNISFVRSIKISQTRNVMLFSYSLTNNDTIDPVEISVFETFDPDQGLISGGSYGTYNDVVDTGELRVAQAVDESGLTFMIGTTDSRMTLAAGSPFAIDNGNILNTFFTAPYDGEGTYDDEGIHIGLRVTLEADTTTTSVAAAGSAQNSDSSSVVGNAADDIVTELIGDELNADLAERILREEVDRPIIHSVTVSETSSGGVLWWLILPLACMAMSFRRCGKCPVLM